tara:strand:- start:2301 stop:2762 length:462 start_codon:yes stop_codon:yes gene_type:complete
MANFAKLNQNNIVIEITKIANEDIVDQNNVEQESLGIAKCKELFNEPEATWVQYSIHNNFRGREAVINGSYDPVNNVFIDIKPSESWALDADFNWQAPLPRPPVLDGYKYKWDEATYASSGNTKGWIAGNLTTNPFSYTDKVFNYTSESWEDL